MRLRSGIETKRLLDTEVGEWIRADLASGPCIAWIVGKMQPRGREYVTFSLVGQEPPTLRTWTGDTFCISFGSEVVLDPVGIDGEFVDRQAHIRVPGVLTLATPASYLTVTDSRTPWKDPIELDIASGRHVEDMSGSPALFPKWKLWASEAERIGGIAMPLLDFSLGAELQR